MTWWGQRFTQPATGIAQRIVVVTDVDGMLPERDARLLSDAQAAVDFLTARGIPLVIHSSRTRVEIERLHQTLQVHAPFVSECGGALFLPRGCFPVVPPNARAAVGCEVIEFGRRYHEVVDAFRRACRDTAVDVVGFAELSIHEAARELSAAPAQAQLAKLREYSELFRIVDETHPLKSRLFKALHRRGLRCWPAGRHYLVTAAVDRAESLRTLRAIWKQAWGEPLVVGLGDSEDDVVWLRHVDIAILIPSANRSTPPRVSSKLPTWHVARSSGPRGWSEAIFEHVGSLLSSRKQTRPTSSLVNPTGAHSDGRPP